MEASAGKYVESQSLRALLFMSFSTLGIVYADMRAPSDFLHLHGKADAVPSGTSPLYVLNGIFPASGDVPSEEDVIGAISCIIWTLTIIPLIKYSIIALRFGTGSGEGGPFALFSALYPGRDEEGDDIAAITTDVDLTRTKSLNEKDPSRKLELKDNFVTRSIHRPLPHLLLMGVALFAVSLTLSDGALTPAVSVVTAVEGLQVGVPSLSDGSIIGISCAFLICLYAAQFFGTQHISFVFAPLITVWFGVLAGSGIANITHYPGIWRAWDPSRLVAWFIRTGDWTLLNGVLLCVTGSEAFFACLGQFSAPAITIAFSCVVYPCVILAYLGQGARLITDGPDVLSNIFYQTIPGGTGNGLFWFTLVMAVIAAVIASQAMITASFSLLVQLMSYQAIPRLRAIRTSNTHRGQVMIPSANIVLLAASVGLVGGFGTDAGLTNAYGFAVAAVFICTTVMLTISMPVRKGWPIIVALAFFAWFGFVDGLFWAAALYKVPEGAYVPLTSACIILLFCIFWAWARGLELAYVRLHKVRLPSLLAPYKAPANVALPDEPEDNDDDVVASVRAQSSAIEIMPLAHKDSVGKMNRSPSALSEDVKAVPAYTVDASAHTALRLIDKQDALVRTPLVAFFHKNTPGVAAPASFETFLRSYPALPSVVVFLTVKFVAEPHLDLCARLEVRKIRTVSGFYRATARFGYRDTVDLRNLADPLVDLIVSIESREQDDMTTETISAVREAARSAVTHIMPYYAPVAASSSIKWPVIGFLATWARKFLLEEVYSRIALVFPEDEGYLFSDANLRVAVPAVL